MRIAAIMAAMLCLAAPRVASARPPEVQDLRACAEQALKDWRVPGMAVAVVRDDAVVLIEGYGVRRLDEPAPVDVDTVFAIGSNTKAFTAALVAMEVGAGRMAWDGPVVRYLPDFQLSDPWVTREVTIRDLLVHRTGLARGDLLWHGSGLERAEIVRRLRWLPQRLPFRSRYDYNNLGYIVVGEALSAASGVSWDDMIRSRLFQPLGMTRSSTSIVALETLDNVAAPHWIESGSAVVIPRMNLDNLGAAGAVNSSAADMARWLRFQLADGKAPDGRVVAPERPLRTTRTAQIATPTALDDLSPTTHFNAYGMGWAQFDYQGRMVLQHTGGVDGMQSEMVLVPEEKFGFVILTNAEGHDLSRAMIYRLLDLYLDVPPRDWSNLLLDRFHQDDEAGETSAAPSAPVAPPRPLGDYVGIYADPLYGEVVVTRSGRDLTLAFGPLHRLTLSPHDRDAFRGLWNHPRLGTSTVVFSQNGDGAVDRLQLDAIGSFIRKPAAP